MIGKEVNEVCRRIWKRPILKNITKNHYMQSIKKKKIMKQFFNISKIFLHTVIKGLEFYLPIKVQPLTNP
jgi:hypothetical protein